MRTLSSILFILAVLATSDLTVLSGHASAQNMYKRRTVTAKAATLQHEDVRKHHACPHCGMDREKYSHARVLITYSDGFSVGVCSIHCAVIELKTSKTKIVRSLEVADFQSGKLIPAEGAVWVMGGNRKGVMTAVPKWAFASRKDAMAFIRTNGGTISTYREAFSHAEKE